MYFEKDLKIEEDDQCYTCTYIGQGIMCPFVEALTVKIAFLDGEVKVTNCGFYVKHERRLKVVK